MSVDQPNANPKLVYFALPGTLEMEMEPIQDMLNYDLGESHYSVHQLQTERFKSSKDILDKTEGSQVVILDAGWGWSDQKQAAFSLFLQAMPNMQQQGSKTILCSPMIVQEFNLSDPSKQDYPLLGEACANQLDHNFDVVLDMRKTEKPVVAVISKALSQLGVI